VATDAVLCPTGDVARAILSATLRGASVAVGILLPDVPLGVKTDRSGAVVRAPLLELEVAVPWFEAGWPELAEADGLLVVGTAVLGAGVVGCEGEAVEVAVGVGAVAVAVDGEAGETVALFDCVLVCVGALFVVVGLAAGDWLSATGALAEEGADESADRVGLFERMGAVGGGGGGVESDGLALAGGLVVSGDGLLLFKFVLSVIAGIGTWLAELGVL
jgi:hypothetical protein